MTELHRHIDEYLALRHALGFKLEREGMLLPEFASYLEERGRAHITTDLALQWAIQPATAHPRWRARRLSMVRLLATHLAALDSRTEIPPPDLLPYPKQRGTPYLYSDDDVTRLIATTATLRFPLGRSTYATLLGLLACTGMRVGEAIALDRTDVDWQEGLLTIRHAKFGKAREVVLHPTTVAHLRAYARVRDRLVRQPRSPSFFVSKVGRRLIYNNVGFVFLRLVRRAGLADRRPRRPRIHDLRHTFAVNTLLRWYRSGLDVEAWLPRLSTYLGHVSPSATYWYLTATPELLDAAAAYAERRLRSRP